MSDLKYERGIYMKKGLLFVLVLTLCLLTISASGEESQHISAFRNGIRLGCTIDAVMAAEERSPDVTGDTYILYKGISSVEHVANVYYGFSDGILDTCALIFVVDSSAPSKHHVEFYDRLDILLSEKYGIADIARVETWDDPEDKSDSFRLDFYLALGRVDVRTEWHLDNLCITHMLNEGDPARLNISHAILYTHEPFDDLPNLTAFISASGISDTDTSGI